jgi:hypothetical protein
MRVDLHMLQPNPMRDFAVDPLALKYFHDIGNSEKDVRMLVERIITRYRCLEARLRQSTSGPDPTRGSA